MDTLLSHKTTNKHTLDYVLQYYIIILYYKNSLVQNLSFGHRHSSFTFEVDRQITCIWTCLGHRLISVCVFTCVCMFIYVCIHAHVWLWGPLCPLLHVKWWLCLFRTHTGYKSFTEGWIEVEATSLGVCPCPPAADQSLWKFSHSHPATNSSSPWVLMDK